MHIHEAHGINRILKMQETIVVYYPEKTASLPLSAAKLLFFTKQAKQR